MKTVPCMYCKALVGFILHPQRGLLKVHPQTQERHSCDPTDEVYRQWLKRTWKPDDAKKLEEIRRRLGVKQKQRKAKMTA